MFLKNIEIMKKECLRENNKRKLRRPVLQKKPIGETPPPHKHLEEI